MKARNLRILESLRRSCLRSCSASLLRARAQRREKVRRSSSPIGGRARRRMSHTRRRIGGARAQAQPAALPMRRGVWMQQTKSRGGWSTGESAGLSTGSVRSTASYAPGSATRQCRPTWLIFSAGQRRKREPHASRRSSTETGAASGTVAYLPVLLPLPERSGPGSMAGRVVGPGSQSHLDLRKPESWRP